MIEQIKSFAKEVLQVPTEIIEKLDAENPTLFFDELKTTVQNRNLDLQARQKQERQNQLIRGTKAMEDAIKTHFKELIEEAEEDLKGEALVKFIKEKQAAQLLNFAGSDTKVKDLQTQYEKIVKEKDRQIEDATSKAVTPLKEENENLKRELFSIKLVQKASPLISELQEKYIMPVNETVRQRRLRDVYDEIGRVKTKVDNDGNEYVLDDEGNLKLDSYNSAISFKRYVDFVMSNNFDIKQSNGTGTTGSAAGQQAGNGTLKPEIPEPKSLEDFQKVLKDTKIDAQMKKDYIIKYSRKF